MVQSGARAIVWVALGALAVSGCKNQEKCDEAIRTTRNAIGMEDMNSARQWREHTWKVCSDSAVVATLDQEIVAKEKEIIQAEQDKKKKEADAAQARVEQAKKYWQKFDKLDEEKQTKSVLKKYYSKTKKLVEGLQPEYVKQLEDFNKTQYKKRLSKAKDDKK